MPESPTPAPAHGPDDDGMIRVRGARQHNLHSVDVAVPRGALVAFTGVSGSGKSSLAFGTIYAESQRRFLESVAPYARRLVQQAGTPDVDDVTGLPPAIALAQRRSGGSSRSTVGTITAASSSLRMLMSRAGTYPPEAAGRLDSDAFSPNTAEGACRECHGLGEQHDVTEETLVPDPGLSIREGAVAAWPGAWQGKNQRDILATLGHDIDRPWRELPQHDRTWILFTDEQPVVTVHAEREAHRIQRPYKGTYMSARRYVMRTLSESHSEKQRQRALRFVRTAACSTCKGARLRADALAVTWAGRSIAELGDMPLRDLTALLHQPAAAGGEPAGSAQAQAARQLIADIVSRLGVLVELGLGYLTLQRSTATLSAGELQRIRLATQLRSALFGVVYVLDEPSAGLHPADAQPLMRVLGELVAGGNSLLVVEHDMDIVREADWVVDVGPGAGVHGGHVLYSGPVPGLEKVTASATARFLFGAGCNGNEAQPDVPATTRERRRPAGYAELQQLHRNNLAGIDVSVPLKAFTAITGVSGAGKSSLLTELAAAQDAGRLPQVDRVVSVDQAPIGRTPRSNLATYTGLFDAVRRLYAGLDLARERGYDAGRFSFNVAGGRCETCQGEGAVAVELLFMPGTWALCPDCHGSRYEPQTLEVVWNGLSIAGVLELTVDEAHERFAHVRAVRRSLDTLRSVGLGYLRLGQPATELSGGEAQRIKLASELQRRARGHVLYLLDEPTTGLHPADAELLTAQLHRLVDAGHTVVVVEHDMDVVAGADWVIDMGPGGGDAGGKVVASGLPQVVAGDRSSVTGPWLAPRLR